MHFRKNHCCASLNLSEQNMRRRAVHPKKFAIPSAHGQSLDVFKIYGPVHFRENDWSTVLTAISKLRESQN